MSQVQTHLGATAAPLTNPQIPANEDDSANRRQYLLAEKFGIHAVDMGRKSFSDGDTHLSIDRSATNSSITVYLAPGDRIMADETLEDSNTDPGINLKSGTISFFRPWRHFSRKTGKESAVMRSFVNVVNEVQGTTLKAEGASVVAINLDKAGGVLRCAPGAFIAGVNGNGHKETEAGFSWKYWTNKLGRDETIRQKLKGSRYVFLETDGALSLTEILPGKSTLVRPEHFLASSGNLKRGFGIKWHFLSRIIHGDRMRYVKLFNDTREPGYALMAATTHEDRKKKKSGPEAVPA